MTERKQLMKFFANTAQQDFFTQSNSDGKFIVSVLLDDKFFFCIFDKAENFFSGQVCYNDAEKAYSNFAEFMNAIKAENEVEGY